MAVPPYLLSSVDIYIFTILSILDIVKRGWDYLQFLCDFSKKWFYNKYIIDGKRKETWHLRSGNEAATAFYGRRLWR
jgi:hypothetical protein